MIDFIKNNTLSFIILIVNIVLFIIVIISNIKIKKIREESKDFAKKMGDGKDIKQILESYMDRVADLEIALSETNGYCKLLDKRIMGCVQKVGIVRFSAYKDSGKDLSFAVALLDEKNNGVVFNGIYSREMSTTYAKPIENGTSKYNMTPEENQAVLRAMEE